MECPKEKIKCTFEGCEVETERDQMAKHKENCDFRNMNCEYCGKSCTFICLKNQHYEECEKFPVKCTLGCGEVVERMNLKYHVDENCPFKEVNCPLFNIGCDCKIKRSLLPEHIKSNSPSHFTLIGRAFDNKVLKLNNEDYIKLSDFNAFKEEVLKQNKEDYVKQREFNAFKEEVRNEFKNIKSDISALNTQFHTFTKKFDSSLNNLVKNKEQKAESNKRPSSPISEKVSKNSDNDSQFFFDAKNVVKKPKDKNPNPINQAVTIALNNVNKKNGNIDKEEQNTVFSPIRSETPPKKDFHYLGYKRKEPESIPNFTNPQSQTAYNLSANYALNAPKTNSIIPEVLYDLTNVSPSEAKTDGNKLTITSKQDNKNGVHKYIFVNVKLSKQTRRSWKIKFTNLQGWICLGLCDKELIKANNYKFYNRLNPKGHGTYAVSSNNIIWNTNNEEQDNTKLEGFGIQLRGALWYDFVYDPSDQTLIVTAQNNETSVIINKVSPIKDEFLTPVIAILNTNAELEVNFAD